MSVTVSCRNVGSIQTETDESAALSSADTAKSTDKNSDVITLTYATKGSLSVEESTLVKSFNEADNGYRIELKDYSSYLKNDQEAGGDNMPDGSGVYTEESISSMKIQLMQDFINGEVDIVSDKVIGGTNFETLVNMGAFADLYPFMENDSEVNTSTLNRHILSLHEKDGQLNMLPYYYKIDTLYGLSKYVGDKENWTFDEFQNCWDNMPEGSTIGNNSTKEYVYFTVLRQQLSSFVSYIDGTASFNSSEFINLLKFCNTFDDTTEYQSEKDWNAASMVNHTLFYGFNSFHYTNWNESGEKLTYVGYPSENGKGAILNSIGNRLAICSASSEEKQNGAWQFIRMFACEEFQSDHYIEYDAEHDSYGEERGFPININVYNEKAQEAMNGVFSSETVSFGGNQKAVGFLTQEEFEYLTDYINNVKAIDTSIDDSLKEIVEEEINAYFDGEISAEQAADLIQNRASILVSERN